MDFDKNGPTNIKINLFSFAINVSHFEKYLTAAKARLVLKTHYINLYLQKEVQVNFYSKSF